MIIFRDGLGSQIGEPVKIGERLKLKIADHRIVTYADVTGDELERAYQMLGRASCLKTSSYTFVGNAAKELYINWR